MSNINKTSLDEAKANFQQIKKFATEAAKKEFENEINEKVDKILKESLSIEVDDENNVTVNTDDKVIEVNNDGEVEVEDKITNDDEISNHEEETFSDTDYNDDDEEIEIEKNIDEMITFEEEQPLAPGTNPVPEAPGDPGVPEAPIETSEEIPSDEPQVDNDVLELAQLIDRIIDKKMGGGENPGQGVDVDYIDDETSETAPDAAAAAPAPAPAQQAPVQEDELLEFSLDEIDEIEEDDMLEFDMPDDIEYEPEAMLQAHADISHEPNWKKEEQPGLNNIPFITEEEEELDEMKGQGKLIRNTSNRLGLEPREGTPNLQESINKIKVQYESKIGELKKENNRLNESNKEFGMVIKNYQESFKDLRKQFDEMQTFNAKLAYANKIFASGGLSTTEKAKIAEEFDKTQTVDDAKKLYNRILQENKISIANDSASKIKAPTTNTIKSKDIVYESVDMKRRKVLAGIDKNEDYI